MSADILAISGSPIPSSNTDRILKRILDTSGGSGEFIKLSRIQVGPCRRCKRCVPCGRGDDCPQSAKALLHGPDTLCSRVPYQDAEALEEIQDQAHALGKKIKKALAEPKA